MQTEDAQQDAWNGQHPTPQPQLVLSGETCCYYHSNATEIHLKEL